MNSFWPEDIVFSFAWNGKIARLDLYGCFERVHQLGFTKLPGSTQPARDEELPKSVPELFAHPAIDGEVEGVTHH